MVVVGDVSLVPLSEDQWPYLYRLIMADEKRLLKLDRFREMMEHFCRYAWTAYYGNVRFGVGLVLKVNGQVILEGLKDRTVKGVPFSASLEAGKLMRDFLFRETDVLFTYARVEQRAIQYLCEKLGFQKIETRNGLVVYRKEKVCQSSGQ